MRLVKYKTHVYGQCIKLLHVPSKVSSEKEQPLVLAVHPKEERPQKARQSPQPETIWLIALKMPFADTVKGGSDST